MRTTANCRQLYLRCQHRIENPQQIISGNEKVVRPRLADAEFFFNTDRKKRLEDNLPRLQTVLFQQQLGTLRDKTDRIQALAGWIAEQIGADVNHATRAGLLSKCDLMTNMVFEFTDTQALWGCTMRVTMAKRKMSRWR